MFTDHVVLIGENLEEFNNRVDEWRSARDSKRVQLQNVIHLRNLESGQR